MQKEGAIHPVKGTVVVKRRSKVLYNIVFVVRHGLVYE